MPTMYKCRLCLNTTTKKVNIFKDDYPKMIELLSGLKVDPNDGLLKTSCLDCAKDVKFCMSVRKHILNSHKILIEEFLTGQRIKSSPNLSTKKTKSASIVKKGIKPTKILKEDSPLSSEAEDNNFTDYSDHSNSFPESEINIKPEVTSKSESNGTIIEEITIIHEDISAKEPKTESATKENIKAEPTENSEAVHIFDIKSPPASRLSANKLMKKRNMIAASNKILNQQKPLGDRRYCNVIFIRKSRREKLEKQKNKLVAPKRDKADIEENVIIKNGKKYAACEICKREVKKHYMKHHLTTHFPKHFTCDICGATTRNIRGLRYHKLYWHSSKLDYICDKCGKKYRSKHALDLHDKKEHGGVRDLECNICGKKFFQKMHLKRHVDGIHKKLRPHKCEYCGKDFSKRTHLVTHWRTHTNETPYGCDMCGDRFKLKLSLKNHLKRVHNFEEEEKVFCDVCKRGFASEQGLRAHINSRVHEGQKCQYCSEVFTDEYMKNHLRDVHGVGMVEPYETFPRTSCLDCAKSVKVALKTRKQIIQSHKILLEEFLAQNKEINISLLRNNRNKNYSRLLSYSKVCDDKKGNLENENALETEVDISEEIIHHSHEIKANLVPEEKKIIADVKNVYLKKAPLYDIKEESLLQQYQSDKSYLNSSSPVPEIDWTSDKDEFGDIQEKLSRRGNLEISSKSSEGVFFVKKSNLNQTKKKSPDTVVRIKKKPKIKSAPTRVTCTICNKEVQNYWLQKHMETHSYNPVTCEFCGLVSKSSTALRHHVFYYHKSAPDEYMCDQCGKHFRSKYRLNLHKKKEHGGTKDFECTTCGKRFFERMHLKRHIDKTHKNIRPYVCDFCGKSFKSINHIRVHERIHSKEAPYNCHICGESFKMKLSLRSHLKGVHNIQEEEKVFCDTCKRGFASEVALKAHINSRIHETEKCQYCSEMFTIEYMVNHLKDVHGIGLGTNS